MPSLNDKEIKLGVLGGGQLARMMALKAHQTGISLSVLSNDSKDPAAQVTQKHVVGDIDQKSDVKKFLNSMDVCTFESEFVDSNLLKEVEKAAQVKIYPQVRNIARLRDRFLQKQLLKKHKVPTAPFLRVDGFDQAQQMFLEFPAGFVLKSRLYGYDGYGTFMIPNQKALQKVKSSIEKNSHGFIAEPIVHFQRELAISVARSRNKSWASLPLVETFQRDSRCLWVKGPIEHQEKSSLVRKLKNFMEEINYVGLLSFEFFEVNGRLIVNETAPRVHNSAHYSLDALSCDQFTLHMKAVLGHHLKDPQLNTPGFAMYNLLGSSQKMPRLNQLVSPVFLHWYGKSKCRPGRKMGHLTALDKSPTSALKKVMKAQKEVQQ